MFETNIIGKQFYMIDKVNSYILIIFNYYDTEFYMFLFSFYYNRIFVKIERFA